MPEWFPYLLAVFIIVLFLSAFAWERRRSGEKNPIGTGAIGADVETVKSRVEQLEKGMENLEKQIDECATTKDVHRIEQLIDGEIGKIAAKIDGQRELSERTNQSVDRIERFFIEAGMRK